MVTARFLMVPLSLAFLAPAPAAQKKPAQQAEPQTVLTPVGEVRVLTTAEATKLVSRIKKLVLSKKARRDKRRRKKGEMLSFVARLEETEALGKVQHPKLASVLKRIMLTDPNAGVRVKAAEALQAQPKKEAVRIALSLLKDRKFLRKGTLAAPLIKIVSFHGAPKDTWKNLRRRFLDIGNLGQQALLEHIGERKDWDHVGLILDNIDPPAPVNVDDPSNPPASYWKARWEQWQGFQPALKDACEQLFGKTFENRREAELWIAKNGGIKKLKQKAKGK